MGGLHQEQCALTVHGDLIKGTGLLSILKQSGLSVIGLQTSVADVNSIKKARYALQVTAPCLYKLLDQAYQAANSELSLDKWASSQNSVMFKYWYGVLNHQIDTLMLVCSFRESNLYLLMGCCEKLAHLCFSLDHYNYAHALSVFIQDLKVLSVENRTLFDDVGRNISVASTKTPFSKMPLDQCHEQNNKEIKSRSGYINLVNNENTDFLRKLEICLPEFQQFLDAKESKESDENKPRKHKEQYDSFIMKYQNDCKKVYSNITLNPFLTTQFQKLSTPPQFFPEAIVKDCDKVFNIGVSQYESFISDRLVKGIISIDTKITKNQLKLPKHQERVSSLTPRIKLTNSSITKLRDACYSRGSLAKQLFEQEFTGIPECLFDPKTSKPYHSNKYQLVGLINTSELVSSSDRNQAPHGLAVDLSVIIRAIGASIDTQPFAINLCIIF